MKTLRGETIKDARQQFPGLFASAARKTRRSLASRINTRLGAAWVIPAVFAFYFLSPFHLDFLNFINMDKVAATIIDHRTNNMATIFSISLVVIGWLITNLSIKDSISYQFLFRTTYLYPIFYFIVTLIISLILLSLCRNLLGDYFDNAVIAACYLMIFALMGITFLFLRLIDVMHSRFFFSTLKKEVVKEAVPVWESDIASRLSKRIYEENVTKMGLSPVPSNRATLTDHHEVQIGLPALPTEQEEDDLFSAIFPATTGYIDDIRLTKMSRILRNTGTAGTSCFTPLGLGRATTPEFTVLHLEKGKKVTEKRLKALRSCFKLKRHATIEAKNRFYFSILIDKYLKEIKDGKTEHLAQLLEIFRTVNEMERKIKNI